METKAYLQYLVEEIHSCVFATVDGEGRPVTCAIDLMDYDGDGLYFLTAKGKGFYDRLRKNENIALTAMKGADTLSSVAISVQGRAKEMGPGRLPALFAKNPYMEKLYPDAAAREALTVFKIYQGRGEWFDLSKSPIERFSFSFGGAEAPAGGYFITERCTGCGLCYASCPQKCIDVSQKPAVIHPENCLHCGNCFEVCPVGAVERRPLS